MNKKIPAVALAIGMLFGGVFASCSTGNTELEGAKGIKCSETYTGTLSAESYDSTEEALSAYISLEIGNGATLTESKKEGDLSASQKSALPLTDEQRNGLTSAEIYTVTYTDSSTAASLNGVALTNYVLTDAENEAQSNTKTRRVYLLVINGKAFYLDPLPATGDDLSKSYYDSVLNTENYKNCTITQTSSTVMITSGVSMTATVNITVKIDGTKCYYESTSVTEAKNGDATQSKTEKNYYYLEEGENGITAYISDNGLDWRQGFVGFQSISDMIIICQYDYSYLKKTDTGFTLQDEYFNQYVYNAMSSIGDYTLEEAGLYYYVSEGVVVKAYGRIYGTSVMDGNSVSCRSDSDALVSDFGTTTVSVNI